MLLLWIGATLVSAAAAVLGLLQRRRTGTGTVTFTQTDRQTSAYYRDLGLFAARGGEVTFRTNFVDGGSLVNSSITKLGGGQVNTATGDFVFGMTEAYLIENGEITEPLREGNLIGNGPQVLRDIDMLGNDFAMGNPGTCGKDGQGVPVGDGQPTLRVKSLTVGGTAA